MKKTKKLKTLLAALLIVLFSCADLPLSYVYAGSTEYVTMQAGNSMTLSLNSSKAGTKGSWISMDPSTVAIKSQNDVSCTVKAVRETSSRPVIIRCNYTYLTARGKYSYLMKDYKDFYITVHASPSSGPDGTSGGEACTLSASPGTMYLDLADGAKELTLTAGKPLSSTRSVRMKAYSSGCVSVGKLKETNGNQQKFIVTPESTGRQTIGFELTEQISPGYVVIKKSVNVSFIVTCSHAYDDGTVTKAPAAAAPGVKTYTCRHCKGTKTEQIAYESSKTEQIAYERPNIADSKITVSGNGLSYDGLAKTPSVNVEYQGRKLVQNADYLLSYSNNVNAGTGLIEIQGTGSYTGQTSRTFTIGKGEQSLSAAVTDRLNVGQSARITATAAGRISYRSSNEQAVSVDSSGTVMGKKAGTAVITVTAEATDNYQAASKNYTITVSKASSVEEAVTPKEDITQTPDAPVPDEIKTEDTANSANSADPANTTDISACSINCQTGSYTYNGRARTPYVLISCSNYILQKDKDYTIEYFNHINAGTAVMRISGKGDFSGSTTRTFTIHKARQRLTCLPRTRSYRSNTLRTGTQTFIITVKNARGIVSYQSSDSRYITASNGVVSVSRDTPAGTYQITVTAAGDENYEPAASTVTISVQ